MSEFNVGELPVDEDARLIHLSNAFGKLLFETVRTPLRGRTQSLDEPVRSQVEELLDTQLHAILKLLDGLTYPIRNADVDVEFVLSARLRRRDNSEQIVDVELGPNGGLSERFPAWQSDDFAGIPGMQMQEQ